MKLPAADRIKALAARRTRLCAEYEREQRLHRGARHAEQQLREATHAQLLAEINLARAAPLKRYQARRRGPKPDMFKGDSL